MINVALLGTWHVHFRNYAGEAAKNEHCKITALWDPDPAACRRQPQHVKAVLIDLSVIDVAGLASPFAVPDLFGLQQTVLDRETSDTYILTDSNLSMDYTARLEIRAVPVNKNYNKNELTKELKGTLDTLQSDGKYSSFDPSQTASRSFIDGNGIYASYKGILKEGNVGVAGRVIVNCVNKTLYIMHCSYPRALADTYAEGVYNKARHTMKLVKQE